MCGGLIRSAEVCPQRCVSIGGFLFGGFMCLLHLMDIFFSSNTIFGHELWSWSARRRGLYFGGALYNNGVVVVPPPGLVVAPVHVVAPPPRCEAAIRVFFAPPPRCEAAIRPIFHSFPGHVVAPPPWCEAAIGGFLHHPPGVRPHYAVLRQGRGGT